MFFSTQNMFENQLKTGLFINCWTNFLSWPLPQTCIKKLDKIDRLTDATSIIVSNTSYRVAEK